jgi:iron complex outermembrane recepter protein
MATYSCSAARASGEKSPRLSHLRPAVLVAGMALSAHAAAQAPTPAPAPAPQAQPARPASGTAPAKEAPAAAVEVTVGRGGGTYYGGEVGGTKTDLPLQDLPQAVRVLGRSTLDDLNAVRLDDALDYVGGVSRQNSFGGLWDNISIRGIAGDINNGMPLLLNGFSSNRGFNAARDLANVEQIEFLKGPAASLYGTSEPGGTLNMVTKSPRWRAAHAVEASVGSHGFFRTTLDTTGPLGQAVAYRLNAAIEKREGFRDFVDSRRIFLAPAFTVRFAPQTTLDYRGDMLQSKVPLDRGVVAVRNTLGAVPRERFLGEPADGDITQRNHNHQTWLSHAFNDVWSAKLALSYKTGTLKGFSTEAQPTLQADETTLRRQRRYRDYSSADLAAQAEATARFEWAGMRHEVLLGAEAYRFKIDQLMLRVNPTNAAPYAINVLSPVYGQAQPVPLPNTDTNERQDNRALYAQNAVALGEHWRVLVGARADHYEQDLLNRRTGVRTVQSPDALTGKLGVSFLPNALWTVYANTGNSFRPNNGSDVAARPFAPEKGRAWELGVKGETANRQLGGTLALFNITKRNVLTADPLNAGFSATAGQIQSRGFDADVAGQLTRQWRVNASLSYIDAKVRQDNTLQVGGPLLNIPKVNASVLLVYENMAGAVRYGVGGGLTYSGKRLGESYTQAQAAAGTARFELPAYTVAKFIAYARLNQTWRVSLDVDNLFDKTYYNNSFQRTWVQPGAPRTATFSVQAKF